MRPVRGHQELDAEYRTFLVAQEAVVLLNRTAPE